VKNLKIGVLVFGVLGLVGMFMSEIGLMLKYDKVNTILMLAAFGVPTVLAAMGLVKPPFQMWQAGVSLAGFVLAVIKIRLWKTLPHIADVPTGLKLVLIATVGGVIVSILALAKPEAKA
jgi:hypothetical protein